MKQQGVSRLGVVLTLQVKIPQLVKIPGQVHTHARTGARTYTFTKGHKKFNASPLGATVWQPETLPGINHIPHCLVQSVSLTHLSHTHTHH